MYHRKLVWALAKPKHIPDFSNKVACKITEYGVHGHTWKIKQNMSAASVQTNWYKPNGYNSTFYLDVIFVKDTSGYTSKRYGLPNFHMSRPKENRGFVWHSSYSFGV